MKCSALAFIASKESVVYKHCIRKDANSLIYGVNSSEVLVTNKRTLEDNMIATLKAQLYLLHERYVSKRSPHYQSLHSL